MIYPGKLTVADSFRIGCIGRLGEAEMRGVLDAIRDILAEMGVTRCAPARRARRPRDHPTMNDPSSDMLQVVKASPTNASPTTAPPYRRPL